MKLESRRDKFVFNSLSISKVAIGSGLMVGFD